MAALKTIEQAKALFKDKCDATNLTKIKTIKNEEALLKIANAIAMFQPDSVWINSGSEADLQKAREGALENNEEFKLALPNHTCHYDLPEDQGRLISQTMYIYNEDEDISSMAKKELRSDSHKYLQENMVGLMKGKTMLVSLWNRGPNWRPGGGPGDYDYGFLLRGPFG